MFFEYSSLWTSIFFTCLSLLSFLALNYTQINSIQKTVISLLTFFLGFTILLGFEKVPQLVGVLYIIISCNYIFAQFYNEQNNPSTNNRVSKFLLNPYFSNKLRSLSVVLFLFLVIFEYFNGFNFGSYDLLLFLFCVLIFNFEIIPVRYNFLKLFSFLFLITLILILVIPFTFFSREPSSFIDIINIFLVRPLSLSLNFLGFETFANLDVLKYRDIDNNLNSVVVATSCTGIESFLMFISAFFSYVLLIMNKIKTETIYILLLGIIMSYFANLFRMSIIIIVGIYFGPEALFWTHTNLGSFIFLLWILVFWTYILDPFIEQNNLSVPSMVEK